MDVSVIIINYNTFVLTKATISSVIEKTEGVMYEVIVVDNNSPDGSGQQLKNYFGNKITFIQTGENIGFGRANNLAMELAQGKYLFLLNSDTIILNNAIKIFYDFFEQYPVPDKIGALGSILLNNDLIPTSSFGVFPTVSGSISGIGTVIWYNFFKKKENCIDFFKDGTDFFSVDVIWGADLFLAKSTILQLKGFDTRFFMYFEETDLQKRMSKIGLARYIINGPEIIHLEGGSFGVGQKSALERIMRDDSLFKYMEKHTNYFTFWVFRTIYVFITFPVLINKRYPLKDRIKIFLNVLCQKTFK